MMSEGRGGGFERGAAGRIVGVGRGRILIGDEECGVGEGRKVRKGECRVCGVIDGDEDEGGGEDE